VQERERLRWPPPASSVDERLRIVGISNTAMTITCEGHFARAALLSKNFVVPFIILD